MEKGCPPLQGLRHLALRVRDIRKAKDFYQRIFNMKVVWEPDPQNCYLSSGTDNLALHEAPAPGDPEPAQPLWSPLEHFGFIAGNPQLAAPKRHRDGSYSCYLADPDGNSIQILYDPTISQAP